MANFELRTEIEINAPAERVWAILTDFYEMPVWNPMIRRIEGAIREGEKIKVTLAIGGGKPMTIRPRMTCVDWGREFRWRGHLLLPFLFNGEHIFRIEPLGENRVRFVHGEDFAGAMISLVIGKLDAETRTAYSEMNRALKKKAEAKDDESHAPDLEESELKEDDAPPEERLAKVTAELCIIKEKAPLLQWRIRYLEKEKKRLEELIQKTD